MMIKWGKGVGSKDDRKQASCQVPSSTRGSAAFARGNEFYVVERVRGVEVDRNDVLRIDRGVPSLELVRPYSP